MSPSPPSSPNVNIPVSTSQHPVNAAASSFYPVNESTRSSPQQLANALDIDINGNVTININPSPISSGLTNRPHVDTADVVQALFGTAHPPPEADVLPVNMNVNMNTDSNSNSAAYVSETRAIEEAIRTEAAPSIFAVNPTTSGALPASINRRNRNNNNNRIDIMRHSSPSTPHRNDFDYRRTNNAYPPAIPYDYLNNRSVTSTPQHTMRETNTTTHQYDHLGAATAFVPPAPYVPATFALPLNMNASFNRAHPPGDINSNMDINNFNVPAVDEDTSLRASMVKRRLEAAARKQAADEYEENHREQLAVPPANKAEKKKRVRNKSAFVSRHSRKKYERLLEKYIENAYREKEAARGDVARATEDIQGMKTLLEKFESENAIPPRQF